MKDNAKIAILGAVAIFFPLVGYWCFVTGREVSELQQAIAVQRNWLLSADTSLTRRLDTMDAVLHAAVRDDNEDIILLGKKYEQLERICARLRNDVLELRHRPPGGLPVGLQEFPAEELCLPPVDLLTLSRDE